MATFPAVSVGIDVQHTMLIRNHRANVIDTSLLANPLSAGNSFSKTGNYAVPKSTPFIVAAASL
jgi:hypothetical protein